MGEICAPGGIFDLWCLAVGRARLFKVRVSRINEKCDEGSKQSSAVNAQGYLGASNVTRDRRA